MIKAFLFDFDGTIANTGELILTSFAYAVRTCLGYEPTREAMLETFGLVMHDAFFLFTQDEEKILELRNTYRDYHNLHHDGLIKIYPGVKETFHGLKKRGIKLCIVTSKKTPMATHGLEVLGLLPLVDVIVTADDVANGKPSPEPVLLALEKLSFKASECAIVGDSPFDMMSGKRAGLKAYAVSYTDVRKDKFVGEGAPDKWIDSLEDLLKLYNHKNT